jgi:hypothetical protein
MYKRSLKARHPKKPTGAPLPSTAAHGNEASTIFSKMATINAFLSIFSSHCFTPPKMM